MFNIIIENRKELYNFLDNVDYSKYQPNSMSSVYFLIKNKNTIEPIHFMHYKNAYFESPCYLVETFSEENVEDYVKETYVKSARKQALEYEKSMCRNGVHYEIECPQCSPFFNGPIQIIQILTEQECLDYLINNNLN